MHSTIKNLLDIENNIKAYLNKLNINNNPKIVAVSKTFKIDKILPLIEHGHIDYGENKVQEAVEKWTEIKKRNSKVKLHMIGKLQTNKVKYVVPLFDYIHSLDNIKLAEKIAEQQIKFKKNLKIFIQINIGDEIQKSGIAVENLELFYERCINEFNLKIIGLMCLPPSNNTSIYFSKIKDLNDKLNFLELSMGMSNDYLKACEYKSTFLRIGSKIFGARN